VKILDRLEAIDWDIMSKARTLMDRKVKELDLLLKAHKESLEASLTQWKRKNTDMEAQYERIAKWIEMFTQMNQELNRKFFGF
jgi:hypothetical protein